MKNTTRNRRIIEALRVEEILKEQRAEQAAAYDLMDTHEKRAADKLRKRQAVNREKRANRTKGLPFSRCKLVNMSVSTQRGIPGTITAKHPKTGYKQLVADEDLLRVFMPSAPASFYAAMLGR